MNDLVGEILEFSRLENSRYNTKLEPVLLESCISAQVIQSRMDLKSAQCLDFICSKEAPVVHAEPRLVTRMVKNLITNAIKYAGDNAYIQVVITEYRSREKNHVAIIVEDNGPGIPEDQLLNIFSPFTRLESARDKQSGGYGLGLAIVKESMSVMKGRVVAENRKEGGLRVSLLFPV